MHPRALRDDASIRHEGHRLASTEPEQHVRVRNEEHLLYLMQLLVPDNVDSARARSRLDDKAELFVVLLRQHDDIRRH